MAQTEPQFKPGDRFWTHYDYAGAPSSRNITPSAMPSTV